LFGRYYSDVCLGAARHQKCPLSPQRLALICQSVEKVAKNSVSGVFCSSASSLCKNMQTTVDLQMLSSSRGNLSEIVLEIPTLEFLFAFFLDTPGCRSCVKCWSYRCLRVYTYGVIVAWGAGNQSRIGFATSVSDSRCIHRIYEASYEPPSHVQFVAGSEGSVQRVATT
jgi:hypothetical protein